MNNPFDHLPCDTALRLMSRADAGSVTLTADPATVDVDGIADIEVVRAVAGPRG